MTTPTTMTTSMITTATTIMTDVVVAPSLGGGVGSVLLLTGRVLTWRVLTGTVLVLVTAPTIWGRVVSSGIGAVVRK